MHPHALLSGRRVKLRAVAAIACMVAAAGFFAFRAEGAWQPAEPAASPKTPADLISLVDQDKRPFSLQRLEGRTLAVSFIFTH
jgi:cytochrome oxidase Cu insertion factor (SCO1/SenC/PrrC family)